MLALMLAAAIAAQPTNDESVDPALQACRTKLAKQVSGDISAITADASSETRGWTVIRGSMRALIGMGDAPAGSARTHHLIRADYDFTCWLKHNQVKKISVNRLH